MRLFVMFDLPTNTKEERREATRFRNFLLKDGFYMMQYSVYVRICNSLESAKMHEDRVKIAIPASGSVRSLKITERQYAAMNILCGVAVTDLDENMENKAVCVL